MDAQKATADQTGSNEPGVGAEEMRAEFPDVLPKVLPDRGYLLQEPCRFCHRRGWVYFVVDDSPFGKNSPVVVACGKCKNTWNADGALA